MQIITAANKLYFGALLNLVGSLHYWSGNYEITVYDLGLGDRLLNEIKKWRNVVLVENFLDSSIPDHCSNLLQYAWKPYVIDHALSSYDQVLWIDAGSDTREPLYRIEQLFRRDGHFFAQGQDLDMTVMSLPQTYKLLGCDRADFRGKGHYCAGLQGYTRYSLAYDKILQPMLEAASIPECIAPMGSNSQNHRYDQTLLSIFAYRSGLALPPNTHLLAALRSQLQTDPKVVSSRIVYSARRTSIEYIWAVKNHKGEQLYVRPESS